MTCIANAGSAVYDRSTAAITNNPAAMSLIDGEQIGGKRFQARPIVTENELQVIGLVNSISWRRNARGFPRPLWYVALLAPWTSQDLIPSLRRKRWAASGVIRTAHPALG